MVGGEPIEPVGPAGAVADLWLRVVLHTQGQVDHMGNQVLGVPQMNMGMDVEQLRQLGYDTSGLQVTLPFSKYQFHKQRRLASSS
jgi:hypothetical protein